MSTTGGGKKGPKGGSKKGSDETSDRATPASIKATEVEAKDDPVDGGDKKDPKVGGEDAPPQAKPQSAGATQRDAATKILNLAMKAEWTPVEQTLKALEKSVAAAGDEANSTPLAGVMDPVSVCLKAEMQLFTV